MENIFHRLPCDIQKYIANYLPLYTRLGLEYSNEWVHHSKNEYYSKIRIIPRGMRSDMGRRIFFLRNAKKIFTWSIEFNTSVNGTMDVWSIKALDQWNYGKIDRHDTYNAFTGSRVCWDETPDAVYSDQYNLVIMFVRDPPNNEIESRQNILQKFHRMIVERYRPALEQINRSLKRNIHLIN